MTETTIGRQFRAASLRASTAPETSSDGGEGEGPHGEVALAEDDDKGLAVPSKSRRCWKVNSALVPSTKRHKSLPTLAKILQHPLNMNIKWTDVEQLFEALGAQVTRKEARPDHDHKQRAAANKEHHHP